MKKKVVSVLMAAAMVAGMAGTLVTQEQQIQMLLQIMKQPQRAVMLPQAQQQILMLRNQKRSPLW